MNNAENLKVLKDIVGSEQFSVIIERLNGEHIYFSNYAGYPSKEERNAAIKKTSIMGCLFLNWLKNIICLFTPYIRLLNINGCSIDGTKKHAI